MSTTAVAPRTTPAPQPLRHLSLAMAVLAMAAAVAPLPAAAQPDNCEPLREQIAARIRAGGIAQPQLQVVDQDTATPGRVVGTCGQGRRKIVWLAGTAGGATPATRPASGASAPSARRADDDLLTECKDGRVLRGGDCSRR